MDDPLESDSVSREAGTKKSWRFRAFAGLLTVDSITSLVFLTPFLRWVRVSEGEYSGHYTLYASLLDLAILAALRVTLSLLALLYAYIRAQPEPPADDPSFFHPNGDRKTKDELLEDMLEEPVVSWILRYVGRAAFPGECLAIATQLLAVAKCLSRMNMEIGVRQDGLPVHPVFWIVVLSSTLFAVLEFFYLESMCKLAGVFGKDRQPDGFLSRISSTLSIPLLAEEDEEEETDDTGDVEHAVDTENVVGSSDIGAEASSRATWSDLLRICYPDVHLISFAFVFLLLAAISQVYIPKFLGKILDSLAATFADVDDDAARRIPMVDVPGFAENVKLLIIASVAAGVFAGLRGSIFTVVGGRVNVRLRVQLMDSLLAQDIGFFDVTKTGDITSRLSSDTTLAGDQVSLNVNVFLRSLVQALGVLLFMFMVSWQLSILAFISVPLITALSKVYGSYVRDLTKLMQKKLADGNSVSEAALGSMSTVRSFDAAESELREFETNMHKYLDFNVKSAVAYCGYAAFTTAVPQLVFAVVVYYGGLLVRNGDMTSGELVSFLLYLQSLSDAFSSIGYVFSSLTQAVGAADKVFELLNRKPRYTVPAEPEPDISYTGTIPGTAATKTRLQRLRGKTPDSFRGEIQLRDVDLFYPARPKRQVLRGLSMDVQPGSIVALVGQSGGGKSSVMSLIQHLYEANRGEVLLDGIPVQELSPAWLSRNVCIVSQEPTLFARSIKKNIMYGLEGTDMEPSDEEIMEAAVLANAHSFIQTMPQKYDTEVGERGVQLSGGQKQRIAIARSLVRKPRILLLDEATSALDAESEHLVQQAIDNMLSRGKDSMTVLIVAHRLSTVRNADKILVVQEGRVVEEGSHEQLLRNAGGAYASLISRQMEAHQKLENGSAEEQSVETL